jgi:hypothetical protein
MPTMLATLGTLSLLTLSTVTLPSFVKLYGRYSPQVAELNAYIRFRMRRRDLRASKGA